MRHDPDPLTYDAVLFDLDGVLTPTAAVHMRAWAALFRPFLAGFNGVAPYTDTDYYDHIDGKQRYQGVAGLLRSRGIELPWGDPSDPPEVDTVCGLGNRKDAAFRQVLEDEGVVPYPGSRAFLDELESRGVRVAVVSSSRNAARVLAAAGLSARFPVVVDGLTAAAEGLASKPDPATYLRAAELLGVQPNRAVVVEDALSGVEAGARGGFGLVVGVDRGAGAAELRAAGATVVVGDLADLCEPGPRQRRDSGEGPLDRDTYPVDEWRLIRRGLPSPDRLGHAETLFALGNGYLGLRGNDDETLVAHEHGTFINGVHETWPIVYPEAAYGFAEVGQTILNLPDAKAIELRVDGETLDLATARLEAYERVLDMQAGVFERRLTWRTRAAGSIEVVSRRMVSFADKHLALLSYTLTPRDADVAVTVRSRLVDRQVADPQAHVSAASTGAPAFDPRRSEDMRGALRPRQHGVAAGTAAGVTAAAVTAVTTVTAGPAGPASTAEAAPDARPYLVHDTAGSRLAVAVMASHDLTGAEDVTRRDVAAAHETTSEFSFRATAGRAVTLHKFVAYHDGAAAAVDDLLDACRATLDAARAAGADELHARQRRWLDGFWADSDVTVGAGPDVQQAVRWNLFQLVQAAARADGRGIAAKGVTGSGYSGHYFWDTEVYVLPYLVHTQPAMARPVLEFRHAMLPAARRRARTMAEAGALFPWRTINGEEASAYYPAGTAQYHIDADVTYALAKYVWATGDRAFLVTHGAEIAIETARMWTTLGYLAEGRDGARASFHLNGVTGPDEYSAVVDDNFFTNVMAAFNLAYAAEVVGELVRADPESYQRLSQELRLEPDEPATWRRAAELMALPFDERFGVHLQDARFLEREPWDIAGTPRSQRPLLLHFHPLVIYRHRVLKQADLVLALYLQSARFTLEEKRADFDFYDPLTTGDSTLSAAVQSIVAAEVGHGDLALRYFERMLWVDLADLHANTADGVHVASVGGTWQALVAGFGGMRDDGGTLRFDPRLPPHWSHLAFVVRTDGAKLRVTLTATTITFTLESGADATVQVRGRTVHLNRADPTLTLRL